MRGTKAILLIIALLLPAAVFVFLKYFGKNQFDVNPLYQESLGDLAEQCPGQYSVPYVVSDTVMAQFNLSTQPSLTIVAFVQNDSLDMKKQLSRVDEQFADTAVALKWVESDTMKLKDCIFFLRGDSSMVMVDNMRRIRGHYIGSSLKDIDRLIVETKIILGQY